MRIQTALLLLVASAAAFPSGTTGGRHLLARGNSTKNLCEESFDTSEVDDDKKEEFTRKKWDAIGADHYLREKLMKDGAKGWSRRLFVESEIGGTSETTSYDCTQLDQGLCGPTDKCEEYSPKVAYWVHAAMVNYFSFFAEMREKLQDIGIFQLATGIKDINELFEAPPPQDLGGLFPVLIGLFVSAAGAAGPIWQVAAPLTVGVGVLNLAAGAYDYSQSDPEVMEDDMEKTLGNVFGSFVGSLDSGVEAFFSGDFSDTDEDVDAKDYIAKTFQDGTLVEDIPVNDAIDEWKKNVRDMINQALIVEGLKTTDHYLQRIDEIDKDECEEKRGLHFDDTCNRIGYWEEGHEGRLTSDPGAYRAMSEKKFKGLTEDFNIDYKALMKNAIDCDEGDRKMEDWAKLTKEDSFPKCLANFKIEHPDRSKCDFTSCPKYDG